MAPLKASEGSSPDDPATKSKPEEELTTGFASTI